jgi:uncharacterized protein (TIGR03083 family)
MSHAVPFDYLASIEADGNALIAMVAEHDLDLPVPTCPGWTIRDLLDHVSGANRWVSACVSAGLTSQDRVLPPGPADREGLLRWSKESLDELLAVLSAKPADEPVWTPIRGALGSAWWRRKAALEVAVHRKDAEIALSLPPAPIDPRLALEGVDEYADEFLPLMLHTVDQPPVTAIRLSPNDIDDFRVLSLMPAGDERDPGPATVALTAAASELLLWMWNRVPDGTLVVSGDDAVVGWWKGLAI